MLYLFVIKDVISLFNIKKLVKMKLEEVIEDSWSKIIKGNNIIFL